MGALRLIAAAILLWPAAASADPVDRWAPHIQEASQRFGVPEDWIRRVMRAESAGRTHIRGRPITSHAGAMGLMQLMPGTWRDMRARLGLGHDPHQPRDNIMAGALYLRLMYDRFGYPGLFAAYNAGPGRYQRHLATGDRLPAETRAYVAVVTRSPAGAAMRRPASLSPRSEIRRDHDPLFAIGPGSGRQAASRERSGLFAELGGEAQL